MFLDGRLFDNMDGDAVSKFVGDLLGESTKPIDSIEVEKIATLLAQRAFNLSLSK